MRLCLADHRQVMCVTQCVTSCVSQCTTQAHREKLPVVRNDELDELRDVAQIVHVAQGHLQQAHVRNL